MVPQQSRPDNAGRAEPFARMPVRVVDDDRLSAGAVRAYARLLSYRNRKTGQCNPSLSRLAAKIGCSRDSIIRYLAELETAGYIRIQRRCGRSSSYTFPTGCIGATAL